MRADQACGCRGSQSAVARAIEPDSPYDGLSYTKSRSLGRRAKVKQLSSALARM
jgi:hypothetical protein